MIGTTEALIIGGVVLLLFGAKKLPELAKSMGQSKAAFDEGLKEGMDEPLPEDSGEDKVEVPDAEDDDEGDDDGSGGNGDEENIHSSAQGGLAEEKEDVSNFKKRF